MQTLDTGPNQVERYARQLQSEASTATVRGVIAFEDRGDSVGVVEVGSCRPLPSRMLLGLFRFCLREILGIKG